MPVKTGPDPVRARLFARLGGIKKPGLPYAPMLVGFACLMASLTAAPQASSPPAGSRVTEPSRAFPRRVVEAAKAPRQQSQKAKKTENPGKAQQQNTGHPGPGLFPVPLPALLTDNIENQPDAAFLVGKNLYSRWEKARAENEPAAGERPEAAPGKRPAKRGQKNKGKAHEKALLVDGKYPAEAVLQQALYWLRQAADSGHGEAALMLGQHALTQGEYERGLHWLQLAGKRHNAVAWQTLGNIYLLGKAGQEKDCHRAEKHYQQAEKLGDPWSFNNHAWLLATAGDKACHNPEKAMRLWSDLDWESVPDTPYSVALFRDTEAAIHAALRDFPSAVLAQENAISLLRQVLDEDSELLAEMQERLARYRAGKPWVDPDISAGTTKRAVQ